MKEKVLNFFRRFKNIFKKKEVPIIYKRQGADKVVFGIAFALFALYAVTLFIRCSF